MIDYSAKWFYLSIGTLVGWLSRMQSLSFRSDLSAACVWGQASVVWHLSDHDQQRSSRFPPTVKPEAPSAVVCSWWWAGLAGARPRPTTLQPLLSNGKAAHKRHVMNLWNCCILLVELFESLYSASEEIIEWMRWKSYVCLSVSLISDAKFSHVSHHVASYFDLNPVTLCSHSRIHR